jgi:hypothetical protein
VSEHCYKQTVWVAWIDYDCPDLFAVTQAEVLPRFAGVGGFVHSVAG